MKRLTLLFLILSLALTGCGCRPLALAREMPEQAISVAEVPEGSAAAVEFALELFQGSFEGNRNTLVSPLSVLAALGMTANGANGETLSQMEEAFGLSGGDLNAWLYPYLSRDAGELKLANSIWFTDDDAFRVKEEFLETNAMFYRAELYQTPFDNSTLGQINSWVQEKTDGMIPRILDQIPDRAVMYLINALAFDADWETVYREDQVHSGAFLREDGTEVDVELMYSEEFCYLEDENAVGFVKYYAGRDYAFAALLPDLGISLQDYVAGLTGERLQTILSSARETTVIAALPKFETSYDVELSAVLGTMGIRDAFDPSRADFSSLADYTGKNLYINRVLHKTAITVSEQGTRAGAATAVEMKAAGVLEEPYEVILDRPFVYMLIDCKENVPFFLGALMDAGE